MTYKVALMSFRLQFTLSFGEHRYGSTQLTITVTEISHGMSITLPLITVHLGCFGENTLRCCLDLYPEYAASNVRVHFLIRCLDQRARDKPEKVKGRDCIGMDVVCCFMNSVISFTSSLLSTHLRMPLSLKHSKVQPTAGCTIAC